MSQTGILLTSKVKRAFRRLSLVTSAQQTSGQDTSWADGLRGTAAVFVVSSHLILSVTRAFIAPCCGSDDRPLLFQRPFFRLVHQGPAWVALFFILSGFVNALKPIKLAKARQTDTALSNLAVSAYRRSFRLFLPSATATVISWAVCQLGAYETARQSNSFWLSTTSPPPSGSIGTAIYDLFKAMRSTWSFVPENPYDQPQWALMYLLQGSMMVFMALLTTVNLTPRYRVLAVMSLYLWSYNWSFQMVDPLVGLNVFSGILLAELTLSSYPAALFAYSPVLAPPIAILGFYLMSFPSDFADRASWSNTLLKMGHGLLPPCHDMGRLWVSVGAQLLSLSIIISPHFRRLLSHPILLWLGKVSFPIYLLHGTLLRSLFAWILFAWESLEKTNEQGGKAYPIPSSVLMRAFPTVVFMIILAVVVHYWTMKVEPWFGWITKVVEEMMTGKEKEEKLVLPTRRE